MIVRVLISAVAREKRERRMRNGKDKGIFAILGKIRR